METNFQPAPSRRKRKNVFKEKSAEDYCLIVKRQAEYLEHSKFFVDLDKHLFSLLGSDHKLKYIRCLALGSPCESDNARHQLALLLLLLKKLHISVITAWDPEFSAKDRELFALLNIDICEDLSLENDNEVWQSYLWYMPHAPLSLTNDILNQVLDNDLKFIIIGNDLMGYDTSSIDIESKYPSVFTAIKEIDSSSAHCWKRHTVDNKLFKDEVFFQAFNEISIQIRMSNKISLN